MSRIALSVVALVALSVFDTAQRASAEDLFPDKVLEAAVRQYVFEKRNNDEPLTEKDVQDIAVIEHWGYTYDLDGKRVEQKKIKDLTGLEKCRSLAQLDLRDHQIGDLRPLKDLKNLQSLSLENNRIDDIEPLAELTKLQYLNLENNQIKSIAPVGHLENMRSLYLTNNKIKKIGAVRNLSKIWSLYLGGNQIADLEPLAGLRFLDTIGLEDNEISDLSPLANLKPRSFLFLQNNKITDLSVLVEMAKKDREGRQDFAPFWEVYLSGNPLSKKAQTNQLKELRKYSVAERIKFE